MTMPSATLSSRSPATLRQASSYRAHQAIRPAARRRADRNHVEERGHRDSP